MAKITLVSGLLAGLALLAPLPAAAQEAETHHVTDYAFSFEGPFGRFDQAQLQRGLQVYTEVCSACHGLKFVPFRELAEPGGPAMSEEQMRAYAAMHDVEDPATGEIGPATPSDHFAELADPNAPDLSLMAKARHGFEGPSGLLINQLLHGIGGPEYIATLIHSYTGEERSEAGATLYENTVFPGGWISMPPPLSADQVTYMDGTPATVEQMSQDVAAFLMWAAEPRMMARKAAGLTAVLFLIVLTGLLWMTNKKILGAPQGARLTAADAGAVPPAARVAEVVSVFTHASTSPALVATADGGAWVLKFAGAGPGPFGLLTELLAIGIARALGAPAPPARPLWLPPGFPWMAGTDEFDSMLQRSYGWNLGIGYLPGARPVAAAELALCDPTALDAIARADALLQNVDRTAQNPNLLAASGRLWSIDYDACLYLSRALGPPRPPVRTLPPGHLLAGRAAAAPPPDLDLAALVASAPDDWVAATGTGRGGLEAALHRYFALTAQS